MDPRNRPDAQAQLDTRHPTSPGQSDALRPLIEATTFYLCQPSALLHLGPSMACDAEGADRRLTVRATPYGVRLEGMLLAAAPPSPSVQDCRMPGDRAGRHALAVDVHPAHPRYKALHTLARRLACTPPTPHQASPGTLPSQCAQRLIERFIEIALSASSPVPPLDARVEHVLQSLDADIDRPFQELAAGLCLSPSRLSHLFSAELGVSFRSYVLWKRTMLAWELAASAPALPLTDIAHTTGFADSAHLSRAFRALLGATPTTLRGRLVCPLHPTLLPIASAMPALPTLAERKKPSRTDEGSGWGSTRGRSDAAFHGLLSTWSTRS